MPLIGLALKRACFSSNQNLLVDVSPPEVGRYEVTLHGRSAVRSTRAGEAEDSLLGFDDVCPLLPPLQNFGFVQVGFSVDLIEVVSVSVSLREVQWMLQRKTSGPGGPGGGMATLLMKHIAKEKRRLHSLTSSNSSRKTFSQRGQESISTPTGGSM